MANKTVPTILIVLLVAAGAVFFLGNTKESSSIKQVTTEPTITADPTIVDNKANFPFGATSHCRKVPAFISKLAMRMPSIDSRLTDSSMGLLIRDFSKKDEVWQHPSWKISGYVGAFERDDKGNIYVTPLPYVSLQDNPPEKQNQIYRIDSKTGEMSLFMVLPATDKPNNKNPFGTMGLHFDCDTKSLYVSSVAGSKPMQEKGVILQVDINTKKILSKFENTDVIGLGVFNTPQGKKLYFGSARDPYLYSVALDKQGHFVGDKKYELSLSELEGGDTTIIKQIKFKLKNNKATMVLKDMEFGFRLLAENNPIKKKYNFEFDQKESKWTFKGLGTY